MIRLLEERSERVFSLKEGTLYPILHGLGRTIALSGSLLLTLETAIYLVENLGYQFSHFSNRPFLAEGWSSITITALAAGMVLSVWRYDRVVTEKERKKVSENATI